MLRAQVFEIGNKLVTFENDGENATIRADKYAKKQDNFNLVKLERAELTLPLPEFRKLMDILSKTKFMFSNENK